MKPHAKQIVIEGRRIGEVRGEILSKTICGSRHFLRDPLAIAFSERGLQEAEGMGTRTLEVLDAESGSIYRVDLEIFRKFAFRVQRGGFESQLGLRLERWQSKGKRRRRPIDDHAVTPAISVRWTPQPARRRKTKTTPGNHPPPDVTTTESVEQMELFA